MLNKTVLSTQTPVDTEDVQPAPNIDHLLSNIGRTGLPGEASGERAPPSALTVNAAFSSKMEVGKVPAGASPSHHRQLASQEAFSVSFQVEKPHAIVIGR